MYHHYLSLVKLKFVNHLVKSQFKRAAVQSLCDLTLEEMEARKSLSLRPRRKQYQTVSESGNGGSTMNRRRANKKTTMEGFKTRIHLVATESDSKPTKLIDDKGRPYFFNPSTGETSYEAPSEEDRTSSDEVSDAGEDLSKDEGTEPQQAQLRPHLPPQTWEKRTDSLTRLPTWYCAELDASINFAPLQPPWRALKTNIGQVYFWNVDTNETRWS